jgi:hypothetical protein
MSKTKLYFAAVLFATLALAAPATGTYASGGGFAIRYPEPGDVINSGVVVSVDIPDDVASFPVADEDGDDETADGGVTVTFEYSPDGTTFYPITAPAPSRIPAYSVLWNTQTLPGGTYTLRARLSTGSGPDQFDQITVFVNEQPHASLAASAAGPPLAVLLDASASYDPDGTIEDYLWDFGDETTDEGLPAVTHIYGDPGTYGVSVTAVDNNQGESTAHYLIQVEYTEIAQEEKTCGCKKMMIKNTGNVDGPAGFGFSPEARTGIKAAEQGKLGPYADPANAAGDKLDMTKDSFTVVNRFEVISELEDPSKPQRCAEGQRVKADLRDGTRAGPWMGNYTSDPRYDSSQDADDPYDTHDDPDVTEHGACAYAGNQWCDDDYHGGADRWGTSADGWQPPPPEHKRYDGEQRILWLDAPGPVNRPKAHVQAGGLKYMGKFEAKVSGSDGECHCAWEVHIEVDTAGNVIQNELTGVHCHP